MNLKTQSSDFLGFKIKVAVKNGGYSVESHISENNKLKIKNNLCKIISQIGKSGKNAEKVLKNLNRQISIIHGYYNSATHVQQDFADIAEHCRNLLDDRLKNIAEKVPFEKFMTYKVNKTILIPIECANYKRLENLPPNASIYTRANVKKFSVGKASKVSRKKYNSAQNQNTVAKIEIPQPAEKSSGGGIIAGVKKFFSNLFNRNDAVPKN